MTEEITGIIAQLERQKTAIESALAALKEIEGQAPTSPSVTAKQRGRPPKVPAATKSAAFNRRSEGQKARYAAKRAAALAKPVKAKGGMTEEGRKKLAEAMKRRWAVKRAGAKKSRKKSA